MTSMAEQMSLGCFLIATALAALTGFSLFFFAFLGFFSFFALAGFAGLADFDFRLNTIALLNRCVAIADTTYGSIRSDPRNLCSS